MQNRPSWAATSSRAPLPVLPPAPKITSAPLSIACLAVVAAPLRVGEGYIQTTRVVGGDHVDVRVDIAAPAS